MSRDDVIKSGAPAAPPFWETKRLDQMSAEEWEALCDGCGRCCLVLLTDEDTGETFETDVACRLFDPGARRCLDYGRRHVRVPDCVQLTAQNAAQLSWMPETCAYRRLARGQGLADWHPLIAGDDKAMRRAGIAVAPDLIAEGEIPEDELEDRITAQRA